MRQRTQLELAIAKHQVVDQANSFKLILMNMPDGIIVLQGELCQNPKVLFHNWKAAQVLGLNSKTNEQQTSLVRQAITASEFTLVLSEVGLELA